MKSYIKLPEEFQPIRLHIDIENIDELIHLYKIFNVDHMAISNSKTKLSEGFKDVKIMLRHKISILDHDILKQLDSGKI